MSAIECSPSKSDTISRRTRGSSMIASVYPAGSRRAIISRPSCWTGNASSGRRRGARSVIVGGGSLLEEIQSRGGVNARRLDEFRDLDVLVHLVGNEPLARAQGDDRDAERGPEDRAVGRAR